MAVFKLTCIEEWIGLSHKSVVVFIGVRAGGVGGAAAPPKQIAKLKSRANIQHKSGKK